MAEFIFRGKLRLSRVTFFVTAADAQEAIELARQGDFDRYEVDSAEALDWEIDSASCERNQ